MMLEQMLNGYDKRLRPNFAGNISDIVCIQEPILEYSKPAYWRNLVTKTFPII